jgi:O-antigen/teichoic acid export membrane protein
MSDDSGDSLANSLSQIFTGAVITFGGAILVRVAGLLEKVLVARFFDPSGYDQVVLDITFLNLATLLGLAGLKTGIVRYLPRFDASERQSGTVYFVLQVG